MLYKTHIISERRHVERIRLELFSPFRQLTERSKTDDESAIKCLRNPTKGLDIRASFSGLHKPGDSGLKHSSLFSERVLGPTSRFHERTNLKRDSDVYLRSDERLPITNLLQFFRDLRDRIQRFSPLLFRFASYTVWRCQGRQWVYRLAVCACSQRQHTSSSSQRNRVVAAVCPPIPSATRPNRRHSSAVLDSPAISNPASAVCSLEIHRRPPSPEPTNRHTSQRSGCFQPEKRSSGLESSTHSR